MIHSIKNILPTLENRLWRSFAPLMKIFFGTLLGAIFLTALSALQKISAGYPLHLNGFFIPFFAGGGAGTLITYHLEQVKRLNLEVLEQELFQRNLINNMPVGVVIIEPATHVLIGVNTAAEEMIGSPAADILGKKCYEIFCINTKDACPITVHGIGFDNRETRVRRGNGTMLPIIKTATMAKTHNRPMLIESFIDNSSQKKTIERLQERDTFIERIMSSITDHMAVVAFDGEILETNLAWRRFAEENGGDASSRTGVGANYFYCLKEDSLDLLHVRQQMLAVCDGALPSFEHEYTCHSPLQKRWFLMRVLPMNGEVGSILVIHSDITKLKQAEENVVLLSTAIQHTTDAIIITDAKGDVRYINQAFERDSGYVFQNIFGQNIALLRGIQDKQRDQEILETILAGNPWTGEIQTKRQDGTIYTINASITPIKDNNDSIVNFVGVQRDVSLEKNLREQLQQARKMEAIGLLAGGVAHDFNNMLTPIMGYTQIMLRDFDQHDRHYKYLQEISKAATHSADLIRQLLDFSRKQTIKLEDVDLNESIAKMEKLLRKLLRENIVLQIEPWQEPCIILVDRGQIEQILMNLIVNARDAMPDGGTLTIEIKQMELDESFCVSHVGAIPGRYGVLAVSDSGIGMDLETQQRIFEPFFSTKGQKGTGLGLATVYGIVKQLSGSIWLESEPGKGSTFEVYLPCSENNRIESILKEVTVQNFNGIESILLVEDEESIRTITAEMLSLHGYSVLVTENGTNALKLLNEITEPVHLLITDVIMPDLNGKDLMDKILEKTPEIKVLFMSGYPESVISHYGVLGSDVNFIQKPFSILALTRKVREVLNADNEDWNGHEQN